MGAITKQKQGKLIHRVIHSVKAFDTLKALRLAAPRSLCLTGYSGFKSRDMRSRTAWATFLPW